VFVELGDREVDGPLDARATRFVVSADIGSDERLGSRRFGYGL
jgi:hypothetical protein